MLILLLILIFAIWTTKLRYVKIYLYKRIQENSNLKGGVVTYANTYVSTKDNEPDKFDKVITEISQTAGN